MRKRKPAVRSLSRLAIGSLSLTPEFDPDVLNYTVNTANASNKVTVVTDNDTDTVTIMNGSQEVTNGTSASWTQGENTLTITIGHEDGTETVYTVIVTRG